MVTSLNKIPSPLTPFLPRWRLLRLHKLAEFAEQLDTNKSNATNILNNLCTGLETFLGFNSDSKGYDGSGIVYSDLDRLCDGVMGFLKGVLESVKSDENIRKYIDSDNKRNFSDIIKILKSHVGTGQDGFGGVMIQVRSKLISLIGHISTTIGNFSVPLCDLADEITEAKKVEKNNTLTQQFTEWRQLVIKCSAKIREANEALKNVDDGLKMKLETPLAKIDIVIAILLKSVGQDVEMAYRAVDSALAYGKKDTVEHVTNAVTEYVKVLEDKFNQLKTNVNTGLKDHLTSLTQARKTLETAKQRITDTYIGDNTNGFHKSVILAFDNVKAEVAGVHGILDEKTGKLDELIQDALETLWRLSSEFEKTIREGVKNDLTSLRGRISGLAYMVDDSKADSGLLKGELQALKNAKEKLDAETIRPITKAMTELPSKFRENIFTPLDRDVFGVGRAIESLCLALGENAENSIQAFLKTLHQGLIETIKVAFKHLGSTHSKGIAFLSNAGSNGVAEKDNVFKQLKKAIEPADNNPAKAVDDALKAASTVVMNINDTFRDQVKHDLAIAVGVLGAGANAFNKSAKEQITNTGHVLINAAIGEVESITHNIANSGFSDTKLHIALRELNAYITNLEEYVNKSKQGRIDNILKDIKSLNNQLNDIKKDGDHNKGTIELMKMEMVRQLKELKSKVEQEIQAVVEMLQSVELRIGGWIQAANEIFSQALEKTTGGLKALNEANKKTMEDAFDAAISEVQYIFAKQRVIELDALKELVKSEVSEIMKRIKHNEQNYVRGFLHKLKQELIDPVKDFATSSGEQGTLTQWSSKFHTCLTAFIGELKDQDGYVGIHSYAEPSLNAMTTLLSALSTSKYFDCTFANNLGTLGDNVSTFTPSLFSTPCSTLLDALKNGMKKFVAVLRCAYVNAYDGSCFAEMLTHGDGKAMKLTDYGRKCAKLCLTLLPILNAKLKVLRKYCGVRWKPDQINKSTDLGLFFRKQGYDVSDKGEQNGELQNKNTMLGLYVYKRLVKNDNEHVYRHFVTDEDTGPLKLLYEHLETYYQVSHVATFAAKRRPCSIFETLCWMAGLPCNNVYGELLRTGLSDPFEDPKKQTTEEGDDFGFTLTTPDALKMEAYPRDITYKSVAEVPRYLCSKSYDLLTTICGNGDAYTPYAVDFCSNSLNLYYPATGEDCLSMLLDLLRRLFPVLQFLKSQCSLPSKYYGWQECQYGRDMLSAKWPCTEHSEDKAACQPNGKTNGQVKCQSNCQPTSPLMSYLNDCLPGHLPHQLQSIDCKSVCSTCPASKPGMPCLTPLGFKCFSGGTRTGKELLEMIDKFFNITDLTSLFCLLPKPPTSLPEHFGFVTSLVEGFNALQSSNAGTLRDAVASSINKASIRLCKNTDDLISAFGDAYGNNQSNHASAHPDAKKANLSSLSTTTSCGDTKRNIFCGPYLSTLCPDIYDYMAHRHADVYLSCVIYLPWTLWSYLRSLYDAFCGIVCQDWGCRSCMDTSRCKKGKHGDAQYSCHCKNLVSCKGVSPTLYKCGFVFGDVSSLCKFDKRKTCHHFAKQLQNVLKSNHFTKLFKHCDNFIWTIREPFTYLVLALWLLSLLYLLCVMVGRLDVLHVRSHLRTPSSHKIAAQSLLAAAQVGRLAKISYLQP